MDLTLLLKKPIIRIDGYCKFVRDIMMLTDSKHEDYEFLVQLNAEMTTISDFFVAKEKEHKHLEMLKEKEQEMPNSAPSNDTVLHRVFMSPRCGFLEPKGSTLLGTNFVVYKKKQLHRADKCYRSWIPFADQLNGVLIQPAELAKIRLKVLPYGIPNAMRPQAWFHLTGAQKKYRENEGYYAKMLSVHSKHESSELLQIKKDLNRTFPNHPLFNTEQSPAFDMMIRILTSYSWRNPLVAYCQSFNFIVGLLLLHFEEEQAFWLFVTIVEDILPQNFYNPQLKGTLIDSYVMKELIKEKLPKLNAHWEKIGYDVSLFANTWMMKLFCVDFPVESTLEAWDLLFTNGNIALFQVLLSVFKVHEERVLKECTNFADVTILMQELFSAQFYITKCVDKVSYQISGWKALPAKVDELRKKITPVVDEQLKQFTRKK